MLTTPTMVRALMKFRSLLYYNSRGRCLPWREAATHLLLVRVALSAMQATQSLPQTTRSKPGTPLTFTATPDEGYIITEWRVNDVVQMTPGINKKPVTDATFKVDMYSEPMTVTVALCHMEDNYAGHFLQGGREGKLDLPQSIWQRYLPLGPSLLRVRRCSSRQKPSPITLSRSASMTQLSPLAKSKRAIR